MLGRWSLNEVQLPKELQRGPRGHRACSRSSLNEVQLPKELQHRPAPQQALLLKASMKCSSRRNCNGSGGPRYPWSARCLNEVQLPKELQRGVVGCDGGVGGASMKCSSRRNCNKALLSEEVGVDGPQ